MTRTETLDVLRELRERVDEDMAEVPVSWAAEYHRVLDNYLQFWGALRVPQSEFLHSSEPFDEFGRPFTGERIVCMGDALARQLDAAIEFLR